MRVFQLNKALVLAARKLGEATECLHFATLLHKITTYLLEFQTIG